MNLKKNWKGTDELGPGPRLMEKEFTGPRSHKFWETLPQSVLNWTETLEPKNIGKYLKKE